MQFDLSPRPGPSHAGDMDVSLSPAPALPLLNLLDLLQLEEGARDGADSTWIGRAQPHPNDRVFGGLLLGQALTAAARTVPEDQVPASLQAEFLGGVPTDRPLTWTVVELSDAPAASARRSTVHDQDGRELFTATTRWTRVRDDLPSMQPHRPAAHDVDPETLPSLSDLFDAVERIPAWWRLRRPVEVLPLKTPPFIEIVPSETTQTQWLRVAGDLPESPVLRAALLAYGTDMSLMEPVFRARSAQRHAPGSRILSVSHTVLFHALEEMEGLLQFDAALEALAHGRGMCTGRLFNQSGALVASTSQLGFTKLATTPCA